MYLKPYYPLFFQATKEEDDKEQGDLHLRAGFGLILCSSPRDRHQDTDLYIIILEY